ncbi:DNA polymerase III subunit chi [Marinimicrobium alkaliphilum]|uniref:DNA polymerase III subunit chi n=1 Tax=Marinimicrobium alkaliphilum TaxID=2202654 RepID=UPI000DBA95FB|nr:DNA polymerase III subunit chi [Marinimicrobium alkaliphilum]
MTHIDFYILPESSRDAREQFACRLVEKAASLGRQVLVAVDTEDQARTLDDALWCFRPESFLPHRLITDSDAPEARIEITWNGQPSGEHHDVLVNLSDEVPEYFSRFQRLSEVVVQDETVLAATRRHYGFYQQRGYPIEHRKIGQA